MKPIHKSELIELLPQCCRIGLASIDQYQGEEYKQLVNFLPNVKTIIVLAHHVQDSLEWTWLRFSAAKGNETCPADIHSLSIAERLEHRLSISGYQSLIVPYPGICGIMYKTIALPTGLGELGDNFLFMNDEWGPWIHLRIVLTNADIEHTELHAPTACSHCGECVTACPVGAIMSGDFNGILCRDNMRETANTECDGSYLYECEICLRACPIGREPEAIKVKFRDRQKSSE